MEVKIWQLKDEADKEKRIRFLSYAGALKMLKGEPLKKDFYECVYTGTVPARTPEGCYTAFQGVTGWEPDNFGGHTLSVSDVVEVVSGGDVQPGFYYVDSFGFKKIEF